MKLTFHPFSRWCAIALDGDCHGYIEAFTDVARLHLKKDAPSWMKAVRAHGPFEHMPAAQKALKAAHATSGFFCAPIDLKEGEGACIPVKLVQ